MLQNGIDVPRCTLGVLGLTFKENCPDIRNSKVVDLIRELEAWNVPVVVTDPWAIAEEVMHEYGIKLGNISPEKPVDSMVVAVGHKQFRELRSRRIEEPVQPAHQPVIGDLKSLYDRHALAAAGLTVFRF